MRTPHLPELAWLRYTAAMRTFIAIELHAEVQNKLAAHQRRLRALLRPPGLDKCIRWSPTANAHLTLRFLGETTDEQAHTIARALPEICAHHAQFGLVLNGFGCFPNLNKPRVLWLGMGGAIEALQQLQAEIEGMVQALGMPAETRPFSPHITLGRVKRNVHTNQMRQLGEILQAEMGQRADQTEAAPALVTHVIHFRSQLQRGGSVYTPLTTAPLAPRPALSPD
jgi:2'-5' RNA ligase